MPRLSVDRQFGPFTWAGLSALRTVTFLKIGYVGVVGIPLVAYAIRKAQLMGLPDVHLPVTVFWMYLGSMALGLGHLLNEISCPFLVKKYPSLHVFRTHLAESFLYQRSISQAIKENIAEDMIERLREDSKIAVEDQRILADSIAEAMANAAVSSDAPGENLAGLRPEDEWTKKNESLVGLRFAIVLLYLVSAAIIAFFSIRQFLVVMRATFGDIFPGLILF